LVVTPADRDQAESSDIEVGFLRDFKFGFGNTSGAVVNRE
jgi:hypothetical protein